MSLRHAQSPRDQKINLYLGRASIAISFIGIAFGAIVLTVVISFARIMSAASCNTCSISTPPLPTDWTTLPPMTTTSGPQCALTVDDSCYQYRSSFSRLECQHLSGLIQVDQDTHQFVCYHNKCDNYPIRMMCFKHRFVSALFQSCSSLGVYVVRCVRLIRCVFVHIVSFVH